MDELLFYPMMLVQVFKLPNLPLMGSKEKVDSGARLETEIALASLLSEMAYVTRGELATTLVSRFYSRVSGNESFFKNTGVMVTPPFNFSKHPDLLRLVERGRWNTTWRLFQA